MWKTISTITILIRTKTEHHVTEEGAVGVFLPRVQLCNK